MVGSSTINFMVYALFGGPPKLKVKTFNFFCNWIVRFITQDIKYKYDNMLV